MNKIKLYRHALKFIFKLLLNYLQIITLLKTVGTGSTSDLEQTNFSSCPYTSCILDLHKAYCEKTESVYEARI